MWNKEREDVFRKTSLLVWLFCSSYIAHLTGSLKAITFVFLQVLALFGFILEVIELRYTMETKGESINFSKAFKWTILNKQNSTEFQDLNVAENSEPQPVLDDPIINKDKVDSSVDNSYPVKARLAFQTRTLSSLPLSSNETRSAIESHILAALQRRAISDDKKCSPKIINNSIVQETDSSACFKYLLWACSGMILWKHTWIWPLVLVVITIFIIKSLGKFFGVWTFLENHISDGLQCAREWATTR